jgi:hypothetical protein
VTTQTRNRRVVRQSPATTFTAVLAKMKGPALI